jgi:predicted DCC family thiol-disulfide oxidoreductase YuxK
VGFFSPVGVAAWICFLPTWVWDRGVKPWPDMTVYYDRECGVCRKMARLLQQLLSIPEARILAGQSNTAVFRQMQAKDSWVLVSGNESFFEFEGLLKLLSIRLPLRPVAFVLGLPPFFQIGTFFYRSFADHRPQIAPWFPNYHKRRLVYGKSTLAQLVSTGIIALTIAWNLEQLHPPLVQLSPFLSNIGYALRINEGWTMFESPYVGDGWFVVPALLKDGSRVDLFKGNGVGGPLDWKRPELISATFPTDRWRKYMLFLANDAKDDVLREYGRFLCRKWNSEHTGGQLLEKFDVDYMQENILPTGGKAPAQKRILWMHHCF